VLDLMLPWILRKANASETCIDTLCNCALEVLSRADVFLARMSSRANIRVSA